MEKKVFDVVVIGGGQSGLATGYYLKKAGVDFAIIDNQTAPGGAWLHTWDSLRTFSPASYSSLPGWLMPANNDAFPPKQNVIDYLTQYETRYKLPLFRPVNVAEVSFKNGRFFLKTDRGEFSAKVIVNTTGTWSNPIIPDYTGAEVFKGAQLHSAHYSSPEVFKNKNILIIGGGNSGAQILAEVSRHALKAVWVTLKPPRFLPDEVDGRYLFEFANRQYHALKTGTDTESLVSLGDIVMIPSVREARERGVLKSREPFKEFTESGVVWRDGTEENFDVIIWCTGFRAALEHLSPLGILTANGRVKTQGTRALEQPGLWLVGYGSWTGFGSATLIGVGRTARDTVKEIVGFLKEKQ